MKYRHSHHAGNFADLHKHVALIALLEALQRKEKGFFYLETHAGRGVYELDGSGTDASRAGRASLEQILSRADDGGELSHYANVIKRHRVDANSRVAYPGSPLIAQSLLRDQDRALLVELLATEASALSTAIGRSARIRVERGDGYALLRAHMPPKERRGLVLIDPPYEDENEFERVTTAITSALQRFETGVIAVWYPIKEARDITLWHNKVASAVTREMLVSEIWLYPRDSRVSLNGSGLLIVNPPYQLAENMRRWLSDLHAVVDTARTGGFRVESLAHRR